MTCLVITWMNGRRGARVQKSSLLATHQGEQWKLGAAPDLGSPTAHIHHPPQPIIPFLLEERHTTGYPPRVLTKSNFILRTPYYIAIIIKHSSNFISPTVFILSDHQLEVVPFLPAVERPLVSLPSSSLIMVIICCSSSSASMSLSR